MIRHCRRQLGLTEKGGYLRADQLCDRSNVSEEMKVGFKLVSHFNARVYEEESYCWRITQRRKTFDLLLVRSGLSPHLVGRCNNF